MENSKISKAFFWVSIAFLVLSIASIISVFNFHKSTQNWDARISKIEQILEQKTSMQTDSLIKTIELRDIKEVMYIKQFDYLSDWIIAFVTLLFGISILSQIFTFETRIKRISDKYDEQKTANENHIKNVEEKFKKTEANTLRILIKSVIFQSNYCAENGHYRSSLEKNTNTIDIMLQVQELDPDSNEFDNFMWQSLGRCVKSINNINAEMDRSDRYNFFFTSKEASNYKEYFHKLSSKVNGASKELIGSIITRLDDGIKKGEERRRDYEQQKSKPEKRKNPPKS